MLADWMAPALLAALVLLIVVLLLVLWLALRKSDTAALRELEGELRDELARQAQATRGDLGTFQQMLLTQGGDVARTDRRAHV